MNLPNKIQAQLPGALGANQSQSATTPANAAAPGEFQNLLQMMQQQQSASTQQFGQLPLAQQQQQLAQQRAFTSSQQALLQQQGFNLQQQGFNQQQQAFNFAQQAMDQMQVQNSGQAVTPSLSGVQQPTARQQQLLNQQTLFNQQQVFNQQQSFAPAQNLLDQRQQVFNQPQQTINQQMASSQPRQFPDPNQALQPSPATPIPGNTVGTSIQNMVQSVNQDQLFADAKQQELLVSQNKDIHGTMIAMEKANISMQLLLQVRNKIMGAYDTIMRMQV